MKQSALSTYLYAHMNQRGWKQTRLAAEAGIPDTTLSKLLLEPDRRPDFATLVKLADALQVPVRTLLEVMGIEVEPPSTPEEYQRRIAHLVEVEPRIAQAVDYLLGMSPENQAVGLAYLAALAHQNHTQQT